MLVEMVVEMMMVVVEVEVVVVVVELEGSGHGPDLQSLSLTILPVQFAPPLLGGGLEQSLCLS